ncbi:hypothetical protein EDD22DRAFT_1053349 [Suillus occidentalis]|nr:hypothetical protein EDD22DRAFT_1053349 [Suillus occidentalis]
MKWSYTLLQVLPKFLPSDSNNQIKLCPRLFAGYKSWLSDGPICTPTLIHIIQDPPQKIPYHLAHKMRFSSLVVVVALAASMSVSACKKNLEGCDATHGCCPGLICAYDVTLLCDPGARVVMEGKNGVKDRDSKESNITALRGATESVEFLMTFDLSRPGASDSGGHATINFNDGSSLEPSSAPDATPKRKTRVKPDDDISSSSLAPTTRKRRCLDHEGEEENREGIGVYRLANASVRPRLSSKGNAVARDEFGFSCENVRFDDCQEEHMGIHMCVSGKAYEWHLRAAKKCAMMRATSSDTTWREASMGNRTGPTTKASLSEVLASATRVHISLHKEGPKQR